MKTNNEIITYSGDYKTQFSESVNDVIIQNSTRYDKLCRIDELIAKYIKDIGERPDSRVIYRVVSMLVEGYEDVLTERQERRRSEIEVNGLRRRVSDGVFEILGTDGRTHTPPTRKIRK